MKKFSISLFAFFFCHLSTFSQQPVRRLPSIINHPSLNLFAPFMSFDGNALLFLSDNGEDGAYVVSYTSRESDWNTPVELPKHISNKLSFTRGYALSADGRRIYFTSTKSPVIGGYDLFTAELKGSTWTNPENMLMPINSKTNEGCPSLTPDGATIYFMRCDKMDMNRADGCKIFRSSKKPNGQWGDPVELPAHINTGNSQTPRIMADNETLIFSSDKMIGNKGGMDLYITRVQDGTWSEPVALNFTNTEKDDQYITVNALGRYLIKEARGARNNFELTEFLIPQNLRPRGLMKVEGTIKGENDNPVAAYLAVKDVNSGKRVFSGRPNSDGSYFLYLKEGSKYELSVDPEQSENSYFTRILDLTTDLIAQKERINIILKRPAPDDEIPLDQITFKPYSSELEAVSFEELKRFARVIKANQQLSFEIQVLLNGYREEADSTDPDLTEMMVEVLPDSIGLIDSTTVQVDSVSEQGIRQEPKAERVFFHNDRTPKQAEKIIEYLIAQGVNPKQLSFIVNAIESLDGSTRHTIRARVVKVP